MKADILLINPPFTMPDKPYISIPTLSAYLKNKGLQVQGLDANIEFYRRFLSPDNLRRSQAHAHQRIVELNEQHELHAAEITEYFRLVEAIQAASQAGQKLFTLFEPYAGSNVEKFALFRIAIKLASSPYFPEGLEYLPGGAGYIRYISKQHKFSSRDIIASLASPTLYAQSLEEILLPVLDQYNPPVVGLSLAFPDQILPTFKCAQIIKRRFSDIHVTVGGSSVSCYLREFTNTRLFDFVDSFVLDDGEIALETLIREASSLRPDFSRVPGLIYLAGGQIRRNASAIPVGQAGFQAPDYSIFSLDRYLIKRESMALLFRLSRGCYWARCAFCRTELPLIHAHFQPAAEYLFNQLKTVVDQTGVRIYHFSDDAASPEVLETLSRQMIQEQFSINWVVNFRFDKALTQERLQVYKQAGCRSIYLGLESYSPRVMKLMKKGIPEPLVEQVLTNIALAGIPANVYMIVGFPTETEEEAWESFAKVVKLKERGLIRNYIYNICMINSYSALANEPERFGITKIHTHPDEDLLPPTAHFKSPGMTREQACHLLYTFLRKRHETKPDGQPQSTSLTSIMLDEKPLHLHFCLDKIQEKILEMSTLESIENMEKIQNVRVQRT